MPSESTPPILFLAFANDPAQPLPALAEEARALQDALKPAQDRGWCEVVLEPYATGPLVRAQFRQHRDRVAIFHFAGHAGGQALLFEAAGGQTQAVDARGLARFLAEQAGLTLVFLNACATREQAQGLLDAGVSIVIATSQKIKDKVAARFAAEFYASLAGGATLGRALGEAEGAIQMATGGQPRHLLFDEAMIASAAGELPWDRYIRPGAEEVLDWSLPKAAGDPLFGLAPLPEMDLPGSPYRYLDWYRREDAEVFFGRGREVRDMYERVTAPRAAPIILFYGQAGVGKSSLLAAGLLPRLEASHAVEYVRRHKALGLLGTLRAALRVHTDRSSSPGATKVATTNRGGDIGLAWRQIEEREGKPLVVILDQFEEVYTRPNPDLPDEMAAFLGALEFLSDVGQRPRGRLLSGFRKEWLAEVETQIKTHNLPCSKSFLERLDRRGIVEVVTGPSRSKRLRGHYGLTVQDGLAEGIAHDLLADAGSAVAPTLQILLAKMWKRARERDCDHPVFDEALYEDLRDQGLGLGDFLDGQLGALRTAQPEVVDSGLALDLLAHHTTPLGTAEQREFADLRRTYRHRWKALPAVLQACQDLYLLVDPARNQPNRPRASRLAHDTLAPLVRQRFAESDRPGQRTRRILENRTVDWQDGRQGAPLDDADLAMVEQGETGMRARLEPEERLMVASVAARDERRRARRQARAQLLAAQAEQVVFVARQPPATGLLLAVEAVNAYQPALHVAQGALYRALADRGFLPLAGHKRGVRAVAFSPDGRWIATASDDGTARLWSVGRPTTESVVLRRRRSQTSRVSPWFAESPLHAVTFSPDSCWLAVASDDNTARLWNVNDPDAESAVLRGHRGPVMTVAFSPNGHWLASAGDDNTARLWDVNNPTAEPAVLRGHRGPVVVLAFSPDSRWVATASVDATCRLWDLHNQKAQRVVLRSHQYAVSALAFSPDGRWLATGSWDDTARLWDVRHPEAQPTVLPGHEALVGATAFSPDGHWLATASDDGTGRLWDVSNPIAEPCVLHGHEAALRAVAFSPDGRWLATASNDGTARLWDVSNPAAEPAVLRGHRSTVNALAFSPNSAWLATASDDHTARLWMLAVDRLVDEACRTAGRNFSLPEWQRYFPGEPYRRTCLDLPAHPSAAVAQGGYP